MKKIFCYAAFAFAIAGCSGGPSDSDISEALKGEVVKAAQAMHKMNSALANITGEKVAAFNPDDVEIDILSVDNMKETDDGAYSATVSYEMTMPNVDEATKGVEQVSLREANGEWILISSRTLK